MRARRMRGFTTRLIAGLAAFVCLTLFGPTQPARATTVCDTDTGAVDFQATVNPDPLNDFLASQGDQNIDLGGGVTVGFQGLCVRHEFVAFADLFAISLGQAPFNVTTSLGAIQVDLNLQGPFTAGLGTRGYASTSCDSTCVVEIPYVGEIFNGCSIESGLVGPIVSGWNLMASWDDVNVTQIGDTCVLSDCTAVNPLESTTASVANFGISGFGSCNISLDFPDPLPDLSIDICAEADSLIASLVVGLMESEIENIFVTPEGGGVLIDVLHRDIVMDGCRDIPEVTACKGTATASAGQIRPPNDRGLNMAFFAVPLALAGGLTLGLRRRRRSGR